MSVSAISLAPCDPALRGFGPYLRGVLLLVAPLAQAFKVLERVVHRIAVFVVDLALARFPASLAWARGLQSLGCVGRSGASLGLASWVKTLAESLATRTTETPNPESMSRVCAALRARMVLVLRSEVATADRARLWCYRRQS